MWQRDTATDGALKAGLRAAVHRGWGLASIWEVLRRRRSGTERPGRGPPARTRPTCHSSADGPTALPTIRPASLPDHKRAQRSYEPSCHDLCKPDLRAGCRSRLTPASLLCCKPCDTPPKAVERRGEVELVDRLRDASNTPNAVLGFDATLGALSDDRVYHLVLADTLSGWATQCTTCQRLVSGPGPCTGCGSRTAPVLDAREAIVRRARSGGASVETISGEAATLLLTHGGLGAWTRY